MSIFFPYSLLEVINYLSNLLQFDLSTLSDYQKIILLIISNLYFFVIWFFIIYFSLKIFNKLYERIF